MSRRLRYPSLESALPLFSREFSELLRRAGFPAAADAVGSLELRGRCGCGDDFCSTFYVGGSSSPLSVAAQLQRGSHWGCTTDLEAAHGLVAVDFDNLDRMVSVEVLYRPDVELELAAALARLRATPVQR